MIFQSSLTIWGHLINGVDCMYCIYLNVAFRNAPENWVALFQNISNLNQNPPFSKHILNFGSRCQVWVEAMFCVHIISQQKKKKNVAALFPKVND